MCYNAMKSGETRQSNRNGFCVMWLHAPDLLTKWKIPRPGEFDQTNFHHGQMWGSMNEYRKYPLSESKCMRVFVKCFKAGISLAQLKQVKKTISYIYNCETGIPKKNYPSFHKILDCLDTRKCRPAKPMVRPASVLDEKAMITALTTDWHPACGMSFVDFLRGYLACWHGWVLGSRPNKDMGKIKASTEHWFKDGCWSIGYKGGRSKLELQQSGTRDWRAWHNCQCPQERHVSPSGTFAFSLDRWGNPTEDWTGYCTTCPLFIGEFLHESQPEPFMPYRRWLTSKSRTSHGRSRWSVENINDLHALAQRFFKTQGVGGCSKNSGRKTLARLSHVTKTPHCELVHVMGDGPETWRKAYQPSYPPTNYKVREQSLDPPIATAYLVRIRKLIGRAAPPEPPPPGLTRGERMMWMIAKRLGIEDDVRTVMD